MAISNVPWFATTVEGPFGVGTGGIFATIVRVVQAFVCVWVIILVNIKFIPPEQTVSWRILKSVLNSSMSEKKKKTNCNKLAVGKGKFI